MSIEYTKPPFARTPVVATIPASSRPFLHPFSTGPVKPNTEIASYIFRTVSLSNRSLRDEVSALRKEVADLNELVRRNQETLQRILSTSGVLAEIVVAERAVDKVPNNVARERILELFRSIDGELFYDEISEQLKLPLKQTVEICNQLESENLIGERAS